MRAATTRQIKATSTDRTLFAATTTKADSINSYAPTIGKDDLHQGAVPPGITMLTLKDMTSGIILLAKGRPPLIPRYNEASLCLLTADKR